MTPTRRDLLAKRRLSDEVWEDVKVCLEGLANGVTCYTVDDCLDEIMEIVETGKTVKCQPNETHNHNQWDRETPTFSGFFWIRNQNRKEKANIIYFDGGYICYFDGRIMDTTDKSFKNYEWCGPLHPPKDSQ